MSHQNIQEKIQEFLKIKNKDKVKKPIDSVRLPTAPPTRPHKDKKKYNRKQKHNKNDID